MRRALLIHAGSPPPQIDAFDVEIERAAPGRMLLRYRISGATETLLMPPPRPARRSDGLWQHSCFELFARRSGDRGYIELNFSPSSEWAAYRFDGYRAGMREAELPSPPRIEARATTAVFELLVQVDLGSHLDADEACRIGLSAVIEERGGRKSYWALAHPPGEADFHHRDCFALELPAAQRP
jgi:hypothetical protein